VLWGVHPIRHASVDAFPRSASWTAAQLVCVNPQAKPIDGMKPIQDKPSKDLTPVLAEPA
jgi:hypothetical protein